MSSEVHPACALCRGGCCETVVIPIVPEEMNTDEVVWIGMRGKVVDDSVFLRCACANLTPSGTCGIYPTRPQVCRNFTVGGAECVTTVRLFRRAQAADIFEAMKSNIKDS